MKVTAGVFAAGAALLLLSACQQSSTERTAASNGAVRAVAAVTTAAASQLSLADIAPPAVVAPIVPATAAPAPIAPGAWRGAPREELWHVSLPLSHILIRHAGAKRSSVSFCRAGWNIMPPLPTRTNEQALAIAAGLSERARQNPATFAELAGRYSEDVASRGRGGSLGSVTAYYLLDWPRVLDAVAAIGPGQVSVPVQTEYGVHVFYLAPPPADERVSGQRIVIGHDRADFLAKLLGREAFSRTREQGLERAQEAEAAARAEPERFAELALRYSEHPSAANGADFGEWSTREPTDYPIQVEVLRRLAVGEVSAPFETLFGWEVLRRTANRTRETYAMTAVDFPFAVSSKLAAKGSTSSSGVSARLRADEAASILASQPERFDELQKQGCCNYVVQWVEGRGPDGLMPTLARLLMGQVSPAALRFGFSYIVPKRVVPSAPAARETRFDLSMAPAPL